MPTQAAESEAPGNYDLLYDLARVQLDVQLSSADVVDSKIGGTVGVSAALAGILAAVVALRPNALQDGLSAWLAGLNVAAFVIVLLSGVSLIRYPRWAYGSLIDLANATRFLGDPLDSKRKAVRDLIASHEKNVEVYDAKLFRLRLGVLTLVVQTGLLLALALHVSLLPA